jgi:hypothetical protein
MMFVFRSPNHSAGIRYANTAESSETVPFNESSAASKVEINVFFFKKKDRTKTETEEIKTNLATSKTDIDRETVLDELRPDGVNWTVTCCFVWWRRLVSYSERRT